MTSVFWWKIMSKSIAYIYVNPQILLVLRDNYIIQKPVVNVCIMTEIVVCHVVETTWPFTFHIFHFTLTNVVENVLFHLEGMYVVNLRKYGNYERRSSSFVFFSFFYLER